MKEKHTTSRWWSKYSIIVRRWFFEREKRPILKGMTEREKLSKLK
jgi:hypothetical protein